MLCDYADDVRFDRAVEQAHQFKKERALGRCQTVQ
jgi:hypothetical protein